MAKKKPSKKTLKTFQEFGNNVVQDLELQVMIANLSLYPEIGEEYEAAMHKIYEYLDNKLKQSVLNKTPSK